MKTGTIARPGPRLVSLLSQWSRKIGYNSILGALPLLLTTQASKAVTGDSAKRGSKSNLRSVRGENRLGNCKKPAILRRHLTNPTPLQRGDKVTTLTGSDECPGTPIPSGTYTAAAPYLDTGDTTFANDTINNSRCDPFGSYYSQSPGADHIYSFTLTARGPNPQIQVSVGSTRNIYIYILDGLRGVRCPAGTNNEPNSCRTSSHPDAIGTATIPPNGPGGFGGMNSLPLNVPLHLVVDSWSTFGPGPYTLRIQDVTIIQSTFPGPKTDNDFDRDGKADMAIFRPSDGIWYLDRSEAGPAAFRWGLGTDVLAPADYDGDGATDFAVFRKSEGRWLIFRSYFSTVAEYLWGQDDDVIAPGNFNDFGPGRAQPAIFRPSDGTWWIRWYNEDRTIIRFGQNGDIPVVGDYDGDSFDDIAVFRPSSAVWYVRDLKGSISTFHWGLGTDKVVPADYDGDGETDMAVFRPSEGRWYIANSGRSPTHTMVQFGAVGDIPVPADYDGDGKADIAIFRPSDGRWWIDRSSAGITVIHWGQNGDLPVPAAYQN